MARIESYPQFLRDVGKHYGSPKYRFHTLYMSTDCAQCILSDPDRPDFIDAFFWEINPNLKDFDYYIGNYHMSKWKAMKDEI